MDGSAEVGSSTSPPAVADEPVVEVEGPDDRPRRRGPPSLRRIPPVLRVHGPALAGYAALTAAVYWTVVTNLRTRILADQSDGAFFLWNLWSAPKAVLSGHSPFHTSGIFHPFGADIAFNTTLLSVGLVAWPVQKLFGLAVAANLAQLAAVVASGFCAYLLALRAGATRLPAFYAGSAFAFCAYRGVHLSPHFNLNQTWLLPLGLLLLLRLYDRPSRGRAVALGALGGIAWYTDVYYSVFLGLACAVTGLWHWRTTFSPAVLVRLAQAVAVAGIVTLPVTVAMAQEYFGTGRDPVPGWGGSDVLSADVVSWVAPPEGRRFLPDMLGGVDPTVRQGERIIFPGWTLLALGLAGIGLGGGPKGPGWRRRGVWVALAAVFFVLSLGPFLQVNGWTGDRYLRFHRTFSVPLPYLALQKVGLANELRAPARFAIVAILALVVLAALALTRLQRARPRLGVIAVAVAVPLALAEGLPKAPVTIPSAIPAAYGAIARDPGRGAVLEIPLQWHTGFGRYGDWGGDHSMFVYYATRHGRPMVNGIVSRYRRRDLDALQRLPVYDQLLGFFPDRDPALYFPATAGRPPGEPHPPATFGAGDLRALGIGYVVYHRDRPRPEAHDYLAGLGLPVLADDGTVIVWKVPPR